MISSYKDRLHSLRDKKYSLSNYQTGLGGCSWKPKLCQAVQINAALRGTLGFSWNPNEAVFCVCVPARAESVVLKWACHASQSLTEWRNRPDCVWQLTRGGCQLWKTQTWKWANLWLTKQCPEKAQRGCLDLDFKYFSFQGADWLLRFQSMMIPTDKDPQSYTCIHYYCYYIGF